MSQRIRVIVRPKPLLKEQIKSHISIDYSNGVVSMNKPNDKYRNLLPKDNTVRSFSFGKILEEDISHSRVYYECAFSLVENVLDGYNGTIFAYGQTGSGKTYTVMGGKEYLESRNKRKAIFNTMESSQVAEMDEYVSSMKGMIPRSFQQIITVTKNQPEKKHLIECSFIEIYNDNVYDLLGQDTKSALTLKEHAQKGLIIDGMRTFLVKTVAELEKYLRVGYKNRSVRQTNMNKQSSRSHCIFTIRVQEQTIDGMGNPRFKVGKLNMVDLAGSQRQSKTNNKESGIKEAAKINLSLSALGKVINCLSNLRQGQRPYIPYRDSKLTRILQDSLGGNTKTVMVATISQSSTNYEETLSTLIYASRARFIQNKPMLNEDPKDVLLRQYMQEIEKLKALLIEKQLENEGLKSTQGQFQNQFMEPGFTELNTPAAIKQKLRDLEQIVKKQQVADQDEKEMKKIAALKKQIREQEQREEELEAQRRIREEEMLEIEKGYHNLHEQVDSLRHKYEGVRLKYRQKAQELQQLKEDYTLQKQEYHQLIKQKDNHIQRLQKLLETVLHQRSVQEVEDEDQDYSPESSNSSIRKNALRSSPKKNEVSLGNINLFRKQAQETTKPTDSLYGSKYQAKSLSKINRQVFLDGKNYESQHQKMVKREKIPTLPIYTGMKSPKQVQNKRQRVKKVDSMISLKRDKSTKLPFITEVAKKNSTLSSSRTGQTRPSFDIGKIKNEIINELKSKGK